MAATSNSVIYIYDLPFLERTELCKILNEENKWEELAGRWMGYPTLEVQNLRKESDPTSELLTMWSHYNHTVVELFILLCRMQHYRAMTVLQKFVHTKYHALIYNGKGNLEELVRKGKIGKNIKDLKIGAQNFDNNDKPQDSPMKLMDKTIKEEKILNRPSKPDEVDQTGSSTKSDNTLPYEPAKLSTLPTVTYDELAAATNNWKKEHILGKGGFGTVYRGVWKNTDVAIKKITPRGSDYDRSYALQLEQSFREIKILNSLPHENILPLYAYSIGGEAPCLVYQCMLNGSLEDRLRLKRGSFPLNWIQRQEIAKGTARGLQYLHTIHVKPLIHGDIKSANILLDKNLEPKIGDFGLAREGSSDDSLKVSKIMGTRPYLPEEYLLGKSFSTKIDTYSYGIVLYELATGLSACDNSRPTNKRLKDHVDSFDDKSYHLLQDKQAGKQYQEIFRYLLLIGKWCSNKLAEHRPEMTTVYKKFQP